MDRKLTDRFKFDYEYYDSDNIYPQRMLHIKIYGECPMQVDLWLDEKDQQILKELLEWVLRWMQNLNYIGLKY